MTSPADTEFDSDSVMVKEIAEGMKQMNSRRTKYRINSTFLLTMSTVEARFYYLHHLTLCLSLGTNRQTNKLVIIILRSRIKN